MGLRPPVTLLSCAYLERASAHVILGWLPKVPDLEIKLALARHQHQAMTRAILLERLIGSLGRLAPDAGLAVPRRWRDRMEEIDRAPTSEEMLARLYLEVEPALAASYRRILAGLDPLADAAIHEALATAPDDHEERIRWAARELGAGPRRSRFRWTLEEGEARLPRRRWLWRSRERVPVAIRLPVRSPRPAEGAAVLARLPAGQRWMAFLLHENVDAELTTMELFARSSYEHPDLPEAFHRDMSRQTSDEARHARACMLLAARYGAPHGTWPTSTQVYDFHYQFRPCRPGSRRELLWRLLLRSTFEEALSLDGFAPLSARLAHDGAHDAARAMESIMADEVFHVEAGLRWSRFLLDGDDEAVFTEREAAHRYYVRAFAEARQRYVRERPDEAIRETEELVRQKRRAQARYPFDLRIRLARRARTGAGFSERDLGQVVGWGYAQR